ncbi:Gpi-anchor transamidase-like protein [Coniochaeta hoffmannii]|uniref:Gpi-anchor transamidase-like protein n=1 Tax=Coniochaeta hoffmannii TaxID=91930 RepID=A0AA38S6B0_9PEZI|nr:Gpi-anchor transamidase-like protein [Coniochaeta hoffmannii]
MKSKLETKIPPLRDIPLNTRPLTKRALTWSCDGELAVAADDSVHVFVPLIPDPSNVDDETDAEEDRDDVQEATDEGDGNNVDLRPAFLRQKRERVVRKQAQFATGQKQILVSHPRLHPKVNRELFEVAGLPFPHGDGGVGRQARREKDSDAESDDDSDVEGEQEDEAFTGGHGEEGATTTFGAGKGIITSAGSTLNHVVGMAWSPSGLGRNRRPILAVLTAAGYIAFYGDTTAAAKATSMSREDGTLKQRDLSSWGILFGVGEQLPVPGQPVEVNEKITGMAWAREVGPGQALLAYANDVQEVVVLSVQSASITSDADTGASKDKTIWTARELARFKAQGPHPPSNPWDPDWVPSGTCFGLRWSPWLNTLGSRTCLLSYFARNYVGFRKITLKTPWARVTDPDITVDESDAYGQCLHLSTDGFAEFEDAIWTKGRSKIVRGLIVTGFHVKPFEASISGPQPSSPLFNPNLHPTQACRTTYLDPAIDRPSTNPIVDLVTHPPDMLRPSAVPTFTLVRQSATSTNHDWFQTNAVLPDFTSSGGGGGAAGGGDLSEAKPQWAADLQQKLAVLVPADAHMRHTAGEEDDEEDDEPGDGEVSDEDVEDVDIEEAAAAGPEVHPARFRMHGLAVAPGGRATAVLVSGHSTQTPDRIGWWGLRSVVSFGSVGGRRMRKGEETSDVVTDPGLLRLTTEGRMWNWMYGGGEDVPGITSAAGDGSEGRGAREIFRDVIAAQRCDLCGGEMEVREQPGRHQGMSVCGQGHFFSTCGASGLAIQAPGISHTCGVCGVRTLKVDELLRRAPGLEERIREELTADVCGTCGGKFVD